ncbi:MAG: type IV-A pilus assembly ATPase PilB, partial [Gammaproteobacteria bacterium]|nr:type IV-A pilus assembly ATPase PilB [Gammaproteobacteria bacterium]
MATPSTNIPLSGLARRLVQDGLLTDTDAQEANDQALKKKIPFVTYLVQNDILKSPDIAASASHEFGVPIFDITVMDTESMATSLVEEKLVRRHHALPLYKRGNRLFVAVADPTNLQALDEIKFHVGTNTEAVLVEEDKLAAAIEKAMDAQDTSMSDLTDADLDDLDITSDDDEGGPDVRESE